MNPILTISIAAYNVEQYVDKLLLSIFASKQLDKLEVILVNDGSKDNTVNLAQKYADQYSKTFRIVSKENGGHGSTINTGIDLATGKYFKALDGDDWVDTENLDKVIEKLSCTDVDAVICDFWICKEGLAPELIRAASLTDSQEFLFDQVGASLGYVNYHALFFKTDILKSMPYRLTEHCFYVDSEYIYYPIPYTQTIVYYSFPVYCYRMGSDEQSVSVASRKKHIDNALTVAQDMCRLYKNEKRRLSKAKRKHIENGLTHSYLFYLYSLALFPVNSSIIKKMINLDHLYSRNCHGLFLSLILKSKAVFLLRLSNYAFAPIVWKHWKKQWSIKY